MFPLTAARRILRDGGPQARHLKRDAGTRRLLKRSSARKKQTLWNSLAAYQPAGSIGREKSLEEAELVTGRGETHRTHRKAVWKSKGGTGRK